MMFRLFILTLLLATRLYSQEISLNNIQREILIETVTERFAALLSYGLGPDSNRYYEHFEVINSCDINPQRTLFPSLDSSPEMARRFYSHQISQIYRTSFYDAFFSNHFSYEVLSSTVQGQHLTDSPILSRATGISAPPDLDNLLDLFDDCIHDNWEEINDIFDEDFTKKFLNSADEVFLDIAEDVFENVREIEITADTDSFCGKYKIGHLLDSMLPKGLDLSEIFSSSLEKTKKPSVFFLKSLKKPATPKLVEKKSFSKAFLNVLLKAL